MFVNNYYSANPLKISGYYVKIITLKGFFGHKKIAEKFHLAFFLLPWKLLKYIEITNTL